MYDRKAYGWEIVRWMVRVIGVNEAPGFQLHYWKKKGGVRNRSTCNHLKECHENTIAKWESIQGQRYAAHSDPTIWASSVQTNAVGCSGLYKKYLPSCLAFEQFISGLVVIFGEA